MLEANYTAGFEVQEMRMYGGRHRLKRERGFPDRLSSRGAVLLLLAAMAFLSGVGASPGRNSTRRAVPHAHAGSANFPAPTLDTVEAKAPLSRPLPGVDEAVSRAAGELIAEFPPVDIDSLPLHGDSPEFPGEGRKREPRADRGVTVVTQGTLASGQSLSQALRHQGISASTVYLVAKEMRPVFNFRNSQPGDRYRLAQDLGGNVIDFRYSNGSEDSLVLYWNGEDYAVRRERRELEPRVGSLRGKIETSLYQAVRDLGAKPQVANAFADVFAWDIDFTRDVKTGDDFQILYERLYRTDDDGVEVYVRPGRILAARYTGSVGDHTAVYYKPEGRSGGYYRPDGSSVERRFLVAPLQYSRISSDFSRSRLHPILHISRPHLGIDYAAAEGTPLWSVADGVVMFRGWAGASGNLVKIRHSGGYVSHYAHLSRFAEGLAVGQRVEQKTVIGYVGHTGLATGSHVCFRISREGRYVNPKSLESPPAKPVAEAFRADFERVRDGLLADLVGGGLPASETEVVVARPFGTGW